MPSKARALEQGIFGASRILGFLKHAKERNPESFIHVMISIQTYLHKIEKAEEQDERDRGWVGGQGPGRTRPLALLATLILVLSVSIFDFIPVLSLILVPCPEPISDSIPVPDPRFLVPILLIPLAF
jgi:hypothetical protein